MADEVAGRCIEFIASLPRQPIRGDVEGAEALCRALREPAPEQGEALGPLLDLVFDQCVPPSFNAASGGYLAFIPGGGLYPAALADFIANAVNRFTGVWMAAPALVQLEANALDWLRDWMGFPATTRGLFTTGGSMATFNAILCARERHLGAEIRRGVLYTSDQAHHSVLKSAKMAGIMPDRVRGIPMRRELPAAARGAASGGAGRSRRRPGAVRGRLERRHDQHRRGGSARRDRRRRAPPNRSGTTSTAPTARSSSSIPACARRSRGLSRADSLTLDPHKGMFLPYGTGALLVRDGAALRAAHEATADYLPAMPHPEHFYDPSQHGPDLSRGFPGLRVWLCVKLFGAAAFREAIAEKRRLTLDAYARIAAMPGIAIDAPPELSLFAFHVTWPGATLQEEDAATRALMERITARGRVMVTGAVARGRYLGRVCVLSFRTHAGDVDALVEDTAAALAEIAGARSAAPAS